MVMLNMSPSFIRGSRASGSGLEISQTFPVRIDSRKKKPPSKWLGGVRSSASIPTITFQRGTADRKTSRSGRSSQRVAGQRMNEYPLLWLRDKETGRMAAITGDYP